MFKIWQVLRLDANVRSCYNIYNKKCVFDGVKNMGKIKQYMLERKARKELGEEKYYALREEFLRVFNEVCMGFGGDASGKAIVREMKALKDKMKKDEEDAAKAAKKASDDKRNYVDSFAKNILSKYYEDNDMQRQWREKELRREWKQKLGRPLTDKENEAIKRIAYIQQLQRAEDKTDPFKRPFYYGVKTTNDLAQKGGFNSSIYVEGKTGLQRQVNKITNNQVKIYQQIVKALPLFQEIIDSLKVQ